MPMTSFSFYLPEENVLVLLLLLLVMLVMLVMMLMMLVLYCSRTSQLGKSEKLTGLEYNGILQKRSYDPLFSPLPLPIRYCTMNDSR